MRAFRIVRQPQGVSRPFKRSTVRLSKKRLSNLRVLRAAAPESTVRPFTPDAAHLKNWTPDSWRPFEAKQQPEYPNMGELRDVIDTLKTMPPLVFAGECRQLQSRLAAAAKGNAFVLQGGDCAEAFSQFTANRIRDSYR